jgi:hypothetical protein
MGVGVFGVLFVGVLVIAWHHRITPGRRPHAAAFSTTFAAALFLISGIIGFGLQKGPSLFSEARWSDGVIWPQVTLGIAFLVAAIFCWRRALKETDRLVGRAERRA